MDDENYEMDPQDPKGNWWSLSGGYVGPVGFRIVSPLSRETDGREAAVPRYDRQFPRVGP